MQSNDVNINAFDVKSVNIKYLNQKKTFSYSVFQNDHITVVLEITEKF